MADGSVKQTVLAFPRQKKRGAKVRNGPLATVVSHPSAGAADRRSLERDVEPGGRLHRLAALISERIARLGSEESERYDRICSQGAATKEFYAEAVGNGRESGHFGEGPAEYRWAKEAVRSSEVLTSFQQRDALRIAIDQLNEVAFLVRFRGLAPQRAYLEAGYDDDDEQACRDLPYLVLANLGVTMARLKEFGSQA